MSAAVSDRASVAKYKAEESITETRINRVLNFFSQMFFKTNLIIILKAYLPIPPPVGGRNRRLGGKKY